MAEHWKDDADINLAEYNAIRSRYKPGKLHRDTEFMIARDMLIRPETVLAIAHSRFSNAHTHPVQKPLKVKPAKPKVVRKLVPTDLDEIHKLERFGWPAAEIAGKLGVPVEVVAHVQRCLKIVGHTRILWSLLTPNSARLNDGEERTAAPAVNPDLYVNLDEQREGYAPIESRGWDVLTQNLTGKGRTDPSQTLNQNPKQRPRGSVGERRWLRKRGLL